MTVNRPENGVVSKSKKPTDSAFKQQRLPAWQPILTAGTVLPFFFVIGIAFIPVGIGLLYFSDEVQEKVIEYTLCNSNNTKRDEQRPCSEVILKDPSLKCYCQLNFTLDSDFNGEVFMYYGLTNFYQNHRRYVKSRDDNQLLGQLSTEVSNDCDPFAKTKVNGTLMTIAPCGAIANSLFSDELRLIYRNDPKGYVPVLRTGIAWPSDKEIKFKNPPGDLKKAFQNYAKPKNWTKHVYELDPDNSENNGFKNEDLIVWMRTAALPIFRKLYRRIDHKKEGFSHGLPKGNYTLEVHYTYQVSQFDGTKKMILSTTSLLGGKNPFLGTAYIVVGALCLILGVALLIIHIKFSKSTNDIINVNQNTRYQ